MRPAKVGDEAVADALVAAFRRDGYAGACIRDLCAATGLKSASLYHRFPRGKADMALAALARAAEGFDKAVLSPLEAKGDPAGARLEKSAAGLRRFYAGGRLACLLAVFAASEAPEPVRDAVAAALARWRRALGALLAEAGADAPEDEAEDRIAAVHGALVLARGTGSTAAFRRAVSRMEGLPP
jgi:TetR/AcrR family transcriptional regulator, lmrAB and yxaGH operons repressor